MAAANAVVSVLDDRYTWVAGNKFYVLGTIAIDASPATYATGGLAMNFSVPLIKATLAPVHVSVSGQSGYVYIYIPGADATAGLLKIFVQDAIAANPLAEMANALAIPAGVSGDTINFIATFSGML